MWALLCALTAACGSDGAGADAGTGDSGSGPGECVALAPTEHLRITDAVGSSFFPSLSRSGAGLGLIWYDGRDGNAAFFAALGADGEKLTGDVRLTPELTIAESPVIAWSGTELGIAWHQFTDGNSEIHFTTVDESGGAIGAPRRVTNTAESSQRPTLTSNGDGFQIAWVEALQSGVNEEIFAARLSANGDPIGAAARITDDPATSYAPSIAASRTGEVAIAWHDHRDGNGDIYLARTDATGQQVGADARLTTDPADSFVPSLAGGESGYAVAWHDNRGSAWDVYFARVDAAGVVLGLEQRVSDSGWDSTFASLVFTGTEYGIAWQEHAADRDRILFARYSAAGEKQGETLVVSDASRDSAQPAVAWTGSGFAVAWQDNRDGNYEIYLAVLGCE